MKKSLIKKISYIAACTMLTGAVGATAAYAVNENTDDETGSPEPEKIEEAAPADTDEVRKEETVYVLAGANGSTNKVIVSDCLKNAAGSTTITETSGMHGVENVKGDESYTENGDTRTWQADGSDIYYRGTYNGELPVDMKITYMLDGAEIAPEALAGKSGRVTVRFDYTNNISEEAEINGSTEKIYVPFAAITGMMLDNDKFRNIEVTNGKAITDGDRTFIIGTAFPGLTESLAPDSDKITIPEYFEITTDVTDFEITNTVTLATNEVFNSIDFDLGDKETSIAEDIGKLGDAMDQLMDGSDKLHAGLAELLEKSSALTDGVGALYTGAGQLKDGAAAANDGVAQLSAGSVKLSEGLDTLSANSASLTAGSEQVFSSLLDMANTQLAAAGVEGYTLTIDNYAETLDAIIASFGGDDAAAFAEKSARAQVEEAVEAKRDMIEAEVTKGVAAQVGEKVNAGVKAQVLEAVLASQGLTPETYEQGIAAGGIDTQTQAMINAAIDAQMQTAEIKTKAAAALEQQLASDEIKAVIAETTEAKIAELIEENYNSEEVQSKIAEGAKAAAEGVAKLEALKAQLDSYNTFYTGLAQYTAGVAQAADGAAQLRDGIGELGKGTAALKDGVAQLYDGIGQLDAGMPALIDGITQLTDGSEQLADGCRQFNDEGISKIITLVDGDLANIVDRLKAIKNVSADYQTFTGGTGSVKFIYRTDAIEK